MNKQVEIEKKIDELSFDSSNALSSQLINNLENIPIYMERKHNQQKMVLFSFMSIAVISLISFNALLFQNQLNQEEENYFSSYFNNSNEIELYENK